MSDNTDDELITVQLPRSEYRVMRQIIKERETYDNFRIKLQSNWIWFIAGGILTVWALWDKFSAAITGAIK